MIKNVFSQRSDARNAWLQIQQVPKLLKGKKDFVEEDEEKGVSVIRKGRSAAAFPLVTTIEDLAVGLQGCCFLLNSVVAVAVCLSLEGEN